MTEPVRMENNMRESFYSLGEEKQSRIINAAMTVFSRSPYSKASTDDIAAMADISKGSLFYHFRNKKELYCDLYEYSCKKIYDKIDESSAMEETDFFERNAKIVEARVCTMIEYPCIFDFALRAYYETDHTVEEDIKAINRKILIDANIKLYENIDTSKFKHKEDIGKAIKMLVWIGEGFIKERMVEGTLNLDQIQAEVYDYLEIMKQGFYK